MSNGGPFRGSRAANKQAAPQQEDTSATARRRQSVVEDQPEIIEETFVTEPVATAPIAPRAEVRQSSAPNAYEQSTTLQPKGSRFSIKKKLPAAVGIILVILLLTGAAVWFVAQLNKTGVDTTKYQGVFLTNGELYIGKFKPLNGRFIELTDVFYLKSSTDTKTDSAQQETNLNNDNVQLIKFGDEVHGPEDKMIIATDKIIHYENLKANGKAVEAIARYKQSNK